MTTNHRVCIDNSRQSLYRMYTALLERKENLFNEKTKQIFGGDTVTEQLLLNSKKDRNFTNLLATSSKTRIKLDELALESSKFWANGRTLNVKFLGGTIFLNQKVEKFARLWEKYANLHFNFTQGADAEIRISFSKNIGSWSCVGTEALDVLNQQEATMNFGWLNDASTDVEIKQVVLHEFGHAIGCVHEHQSPVSNIQWNKPFVYEYYRTTQIPPWSKEDVDQFVFRKYDQTPITNSIFDPNSIMIYPIPPEFTTNGFSVDLRTDLSIQDIEFIRICYPFT